jgi:hypothetical protein
LAKSVAARGLERARSSLGQKVVRTVFAAIVVLLLNLAAPSAQARVGVVLNESLDTSVARITGAGHTAIYFSRICPESPIKLRLCRPGEEGSVMSNYTTLGEDSPYEWNIVTLSIFLYGVEDPANRPLVESEQIKHALEERYREKYLRGLCETKSCQASKSAEWREMVAATQERSLYIFSVETTKSQDERFIAEFNARANVNHFNGVTRNCANFVARVLNGYFPHSVSAEYLNDFGMTSPKAVARSFTHYALKHPELQFEAEHFAQAPGTIKRSSECRDGTEQLYHSKKLVVPMLIFANHELAAAAAMYWLTGRFNPEHEAERYPTTEASDAAAELRYAKLDENAPVAKQLRAVEQSDRRRFYGTPADWKLYREEWNEYAQEAVADELVSNGGDWSKMIKHLVEKRQVQVEDNGSMWIDIPAEDGVTRVGLSASNVFAPGSDTLMAYELLLAREGSVLKSPPHSRETMLEFRAGWNLLEDARRRNMQLLAGETPADTPRISRMLGSRDGGSD